MKIKICIYDRDTGRNEFVAFICKKVLSSLEYEYEVINPVQDMGSILCDDRLILIYNPDNDFISYEQLVDYIICNGSEATLLTMTDSSDKLFRLLPAEPFGCINTCSYESELADKLKMAADKVINKAKNAFA